MTSDKIEFWDHLPFGWEYAGGDSQTTSVHRVNDGDTHITLTFDDEGVFVRGVLQAFEGDETVAYRRIGSIEEALKLAREE